MVNLTENHNDNIPDTPHGHRVCHFTLFCSVAFLMAGSYYLISGSKDGLVFMAVMITGGLFLVALLNFFLAAFSGKLCDRKK